MNPRWASVRIWPRWPACMLRVQGIPTRLMIGYAGKMYHAWNTVIINGEEVLYDPTLELSAIDRGLTYTVERYY